MSPQWLVDFEQIDLVPFWVLESDPCSTRERELGSSRCGTLID